MKIFKIFIVLPLIIFIYSCGIKTDPIPKSSLDIPYPSAVDYAISSEGIKIYNGNDNYTLFVERADEDKGFITMKNFKRIALINPKQVFLDDSVENEKTYKYRFRHYYGRIKTYSPALVKTIKYYKPIKFDKINISLNRNSVCVYTPLNDVVVNSDVLINSANRGKISIGQRQCFKDLPDTSIVNVTVIPYDINNNPGQAYTKILKRNVEKSNLPPQNVVVRRKENDIVLTWDKENNTSYKIYILNNGKRIKTITTEVEIFRYRAKNNNCVNFELSAVRKGRESKKIKLSACQ